MPFAQGYKVRNYTNSSGANGSEYRNYSITVPIEIAEAIPKGMRFVPRMTKEGILYEPVEQSDSHLDLPDWAKKQTAQSNGSSKRSRTQTRRKNTKATKVTTQEQPAETQEDKSESELAPTE